MPEIQTNNLVDHGQLKIQVTSGQRAVPIPNATIEIYILVILILFLRLYLLMKMGRHLSLTSLLLPWNTACLRVKISLILNII